MLVIVDVTPINVKMAPPVMTPEQLTLTNRANALIGNYQRYTKTIQDVIDNNGDTEFDASSVENAAKNAEIAKDKIITCYTELSVQLPDRVAEYKDKIKALEDQWDAHSRNARATIRSIRDGIAAAVQARIDLLQKQQDQRWLRPPSLPVRR